MLTQFRLRIEEATDRFGHIPGVPIGAILRTQLAENLPLALAISTEKARSELLVLPVLMEVRRQLPGKVSLFSGTEFSVEPAQGLNGSCDFLLSRSASQSIIEAPVMVLVEANRDDISSGLGQCMAEMVAARLFNQRRGQDNLPVSGVVTTGSLWRFMALTGDAVLLDLREYTLPETNQILGILVGMVNGTASSCGAEPRQRPT